MKSIAFLCIMIVCASADVYDEVTKIVGEFDPEMISNPAILKNYFNCFLGKKRCNRVAASLKSLIVPSLEDACSRCTIQQKRAAKKMYDEVMVQYPQEYEEFKKMYDPTGERILAVRNAISV